MRKVSPSYFRQHIEHHFDDHDLDIVLRKRKQSYVIYWADDMEPLARLRPTGRNDEVEVYAWNGERWEAAGEFGTVLPLEEALEFVTDDPLDLFFGAGDEDEEECGEEGADHEVPYMSVQAVKRLGRDVLLSSCVGGAVAGQFSSLPWGLAFGAAAAFLTILVIGVVATRGRDFWLVVLTACLLAPISCVGGITASAVYGALDMAVGAAIWGAVAGIACSVLFLRGGVWSWLAGFLAGLNGGLYLAEVWQIRDQFLGVAVVAFLAAFSASVSRWLSHAWCTWIRDHTWDGMRIYQQVHEVIQRQAAVAGPHWVMPRRAARD